MKKRCRDPKHRSYRWYGARGISYCPEWEDFGVFKSWAHANGYEVGLQLDRRENDKGYSPENCRWVTSLENNRNKRGVRLVTAFGETKSVSAWAEDSRCRARYFTLCRRLQSGWNPEAAISTGATR
jgi:hypothetical protein